MYYSSFGFSKCALKGQQRLAQGKRFWAFSPCIIGGTSTIQASLIVFGLHDNSVRALSAAPQQFKQA